MKNNFFSNTNSGLFLVRLGLAAVFIISGWSKFMDIAGTTAFFSRIGLVSLFVYLVATVEFLGGIAMLLGVWTRIFGWLLAIDMFFAIVLVRFAMGFTVYRLELMLLFAALGVAFAGAGQCALCKGKCDVGKNEA